MSSTDKMVVSEFSLVNAWTMCVKHSVLPWGIGHAVVALFYPLWVLRCWCCCELLFVLDCPHLCPLHVLTHVFITASSHTCCAITSPAKRRTTRHVWSTFARRWNCLVVGVCASKVCTQTALLCSASRNRTRLSCFRRHPSQVVNLSTDTIVAAVPAASCLGLAVSASASILASAYDNRSRCVLAV